MKIRGETRRSDIAVQKVLMRASMPLTTMRQHPQDGSGGHLTESYWPARWTTGKNPTQGYSPTSTRLCGMKKAPDINRGPRRRSEPDKGHCVAVIIRLLTPTLHQLQDWMASF